MTRLNAFLAALAVLALTVPILACGAISITLSWAAYPFDLLKAACVRAAQQLTPTMRRL
jgi:hypothetical protein